MMSETGVSTGAGGPAHVPQRMSRTKFWIALGACLVGIAILFSLGTWQVERMQWKQALLERIDARIHAAPLDLAALQARFTETGDVDYTPVTATGRFLHDGERFMLTTFDGQPGWNVFTPLVTGDGTAVFVNRGFVPYEMREPARRSDGQVDGEVTVTGLARDAPRETPGFFVPDNEPGNDTFFWRDLDAMAGGLTLGTGIEMLPFFVDAGPGAAPGGWPVGGTTVIDIPNNHLSYVVTWYGLAIALAVMTGMLVVGDRRAARRPQA
ncbi:SURF1 family protein [Aurantimonas sp. A2-1-M11]|uniref:SURF1 family protein n=1 Tax=Aurantimonas sp. A2-1-M11 TaxID=3113712 RepID=UPI002F949AAA